MAAQPHVAALSERARAEIGRLAGLYEHRQSALLPALFVAQDEVGYLTPEALDAVAGVLDLLPVVGLEEGPRALVPVDDAVGGLEGRGRLPDHQRPGGLVADQRQREEDDLEGPRVLGEGPLDDRPRARERARWGDALAVHTRVEA